jgi:integrase
MSTQQHPRRTVSMPKRPTLSRNKLRRILILAKADPRLRNLHDVVSVISFTGLRLRELSDLRWTDVDFSKKRAAVSSKTACKRYVPLGRKTIQILEARRFLNPTSEFVLGGSPAPLLMSVTRKFREVSVKAGAGPLSPNVLRHAFFGELMRAGANVTTLMFIAGWRSSSSSPVMERRLDAERQFKLAGQFIAQVEETL